MNDSPESGDVQPKKRSVFGVAATIAVIAVAAVIGSQVGKQGIRSLFGGSAAPHFAEKDWARRSFADLSLEAPMDFGAGPDVKDKLPKQVLNAIDYFETYQSHGTPNSFLVMISRVAYKPSVTASVDGAVRGAITEGAAKIGDHDPKYKVQTTTISGLDGRISSYTHEVPGRTLFLEGAFVVQGAKLWQVQVIYFNESSAADAARILKSIEIKL